MSDGSYELYVSQFYTDEIRDESCLCKSILNIQNEVRDESCILKSVLNIQNEIIDES